ncbi:hypothetical protein C7S18_14710 [Ahniella affigens]|uniref:DUF3999 domain-containing protein n=1 Tax=Ahniella affigens TaxID=2021234 RepID=A0A2P1PU55_9GAMM|nr:DUF3999 family protein [Ahniella affigens]AVP98360.1 hypothetical protein C7S18_14710 [Ahniella affigens]
MNIRPTVRASLLTGLLAFVATSTSAVTVATPNELPAPSNPDFAYAWPVQVTGTDSLHQLTVPADVYPVLTRLDLSDLTLIDATGQPVSLSILPQPSLNAWLDLPTPMEIVLQHGLPLTDDAPYPSERSRIRLLVQSRQTDVLPIRALRINYEHRRELPADATFRVRASAKPESNASAGEWLHLDEVASRFNADTRTGEVRLVLEPQATRELELMIAPIPASVTVRSVMAEYDLRESPELRWVDTTLQPLAGTATQWDMFEYLAPGPARFHRARFDLGGDKVGEIELMSLDGSGYWAGQGAMTSYDISLDDARFARNTLGFREVRARRWRVMVRPAPESPPKLQLAYQPDILVFSKRGPAQLTLLAGSQRVQRPSYPVLDMVEDVRAQLGQDWQPARAQVGARFPWRGTEALKPVPPKSNQDYRAWLLWSLLLVAAVLVGYMAVNMLRETNDAESNKPDV